MINLIPNEEKEKMIKSFYYRLAILFLTTLGVSVFIAFIALLPSYFITATKNSIINLRLENQKNEPVPLPDQKTLAVIQDLDLKLSLIEKSKSSEFTVSGNVIDAVLLEKMPDIKITNISFDDDLKNNPAKGRKITIRGLAPSREILLSFRLALEDSQSFKQVDLPISNFIRGANIEFSLDLIPS